MPSSLPVNIKSSTYKHTIKRLLFFLSSFDVECVLKGTLVKASFAKVGVNSIIPSSFQLVSKPAYACFSSLHSLVVDPQILALQVLHVKTQI